jgi:hypothetical protein
MKMTFRPLVQPIASQKGMGLVSVMIAGAIMSFLVVTMMNMLALAANSQKSISVQMSLRDFLERVHAVVIPEKSCTASISGVSSTGLITVRDPDFSDRVIAQPGQTVDTWTILGVQLINLEAVTEFKDLYRGTLNVRIQQDQPILGVPKLVDRDLATLYVKIDKGIVVHCYGNTNWLAEAKIHCETNGGRWSESPAPTCSNGVGKI